MVDVPTVPTVPTLATICGVEIASVGYWNISNAEDWHPSAEDLAAAVAALSCPAVRRPTLKFGHTGIPGEGDPAIGLVDNLRLTDGGQTLLGDFVSVPAWLADADSEGRSVIAAAYPDRSGEFQRDYVCQLGHTHPFVVHAVALLGVVRPGIGTLQSLYDLFTNAPEQEITVAKAMDLAAGTSIDDVRRAYYDGPGSTWYLWIREMFVDPPELIVQNDEDDTLQRVSYTIGADGSIEFGDEQTVKVEYVNARSAAEKPSLAFASRAEARPQTPSAAGPEDSQGKEPPVATLNESLAEKLGLEVGADDEAILSKIDELADNTESDDADADRDAGAGSEIGVQGTEQVAASVEPNAEQITAAAAKLGLALVDKAQYEQTTEAVRQLQAVREAQVKADDERLIDDAIKAGKLAPANKANFLKLMEHDRVGIRATVAQMPQGLIPVAEMGHGMGSEEDHFDAEMATVFAKVTGITPGKDA